MKVRLVSLLVVSAIYSSFAEPGGTYILTGEEKGISEIIKSDMAKFPELYKGETFNSYLSRFKAENKIGRKKYKPGDQLQFPQTSTSLAGRSSSALVDKTPELKYAKIQSKCDFVSFKKNAMFFSEDRGNLVEVPEKYKSYDISLKFWGDAAPFTFKVRKAGMVALLAESKSHIRSVDKKYLEGWQQVGTASFKYTNGDHAPPLIIFEKYLEEGEHAIKQKKGIGVRLLKP